MKLSNQNIYNLRGAKTFGGGAKCLWGGANHFWGVHTPRKSVPVLFCSKGSHEGAIKTIIGTQTDLGLVHMGKSYPG
jgi:hypothetical protein